MKSTVSVVIPLFNKAAYIRRAIASVLGQTVPADEIIVVDDGSTDGGAEVVKSFEDSRLRLISQENQGVGAARNRGISEAKGNLIAFLDADDVWKPRFLEVIHHLRRLFPQAGAYATAHEKITPDGIKHSLEFHALPSGLKQGLIANYFGATIAAFLDDKVLQPVWTSAVAVPKKVLEEIGGFPVGEVIAEDEDTWVRIALRYPIAWSEEYLATYHEDAANRAWGVKLLDKEPRVCQTIREAIKSNLISPNILENAREYSAKFQVMTAGHCLLLGKRDEALKLLEYSQDTKLFARDWRRWRLIATLPRFLPALYWKSKQSLKKSPRLISIVRKVRRFYG